MIIPTIRASHCHEEIIEELAGVRMSFPLLQTFKSSVHAELGYLDPQPAGQQLCGEGPVGGALVDLGPSSSLAPAKQRQSQFVL